MPTATPSEVLLLKQAFETALQAAAPSVCLPPALAAYPRKPALVLGTGKAAASMTAAFCAHWNAPTRGLVVTRYGHGLKAGETSGGVEVVEAGHPSPDASSLAAGARLLELAASSRDDEYLICLISGGGSSLAAAPMPPITFEQKRAAANYLIRVGADIREINCVRKHLSRLKGGRLAAAAHPSSVITFVISDIPGDEVGDIASGPTIPDATTQADACAILERYRYPNIAELMPRAARSDRRDAEAGCARICERQRASDRDSLDGARRGDEVLARPRIRGDLSRRRSRRRGARARPTPREAREGAARAWATRGDLVRRRDACGSR